MAKKDVSDDPRIDPRLKAMLAGFPEPPMRNWDSREELIAAENEPAAVAAREMALQFMAMAESHTL